MFAMTAPVGRRGPLSQRAAGRWSGSCFVPLKRFMMTVKLLRKLITFAWTTTAHCLKNERMFSARLVIYSVWGIFSDKTKKYCISNMYLTTINPIQCIIIWSNVTWTIPIKRLSSLLFSFISPLQLQQCPLNSTLLLYE